jgi:hypothetical protein
MTLVPVHPFDCQDSGSARAFHECARISADLAHKPLALFKPIRYWSYERDRWFESGSLHRRDAMGRAARLPTKESRGKEAGW